MKVNMFLGRILAVVFASVLMLNWTGKGECYGKKTGENDMTGQAVTQRKDIDILFGELWEFDKKTIRFNISDDGKVLTLDGESSGTLGVTCWEGEMSLGGNRTLEVEVLDKGRSTFNNRKMLKVIIAKVPNGNEIPLTCSERMKRSSDKEFVIPVTGTFRYSLEPAGGDVVYKLAFVFYNAKLEGFKLKARLLK